MPQIPTAVLARLEIPWPEMKKRKEMIKASDREIRLFEEIERLLAEVKVLRDNFIEE